MIARHELQSEQTDVWAKLAAPLPPGVVAWRQDGRSIARDGKYFARFVAYIEANTVRERLDSVVPGEWNLTLELLPALVPADENALEATPAAFKARLQILGVVREDVGTGRDYKQAATDAFKRAAVRFGVANELYSYEQNWVQLDGDGKYAKPIEDPQAAYERRLERVQRGERRAAKRERSIGSAVETNEEPTERSEDGEKAPARELSLTRAALSGDIPECPKCGGRMWDNRASKRNPRAPDFKCRDRSCDGVIWPPKPGAISAQVSALEPPADASAPVAQAAGSDDLPF
jgi:hypothetical protein